MLQSLGLHCLHRSQKWDARLIWINTLLSEKIYYNIEYWLLQNKFFNGDQAFFMPQESTADIVLRRELDYEYLKENNLETFTLNIQVRVSW